MQRFAGLVREPENRKYITELAPLMPCFLFLLDLPGASIKDLHRFMIEETNADLIEFALTNDNADIKSFFANEFGTPGYKTTEHAIATKLRLLLTTGTFADLTCGHSTIDLERAMYDGKHEPLISIAQLSADVSNRVLLTRNEQINMSLAGQSIVSELVALSALPTYAGD